MGLEGKVGRPGERRCLKQEGTKSAAMPPRSASPAAQVLPAPPGQRALDREPPDVEQLPSAEVRQGLAVVGHHHVVQEVRRERLGDKECLVASLVVDPPAAAKGSWSPQSELDPSRELPVLLLFSCSADRDVVLRRPILLNLAKVSWTCLREAWRSQRGIAVPRRARRTPRAPRQSGHTRAPRKDGNPDARTATK